MSMETEFIPERRLPAEAVPLMNVRQLLDPANLLTLTGLAAAISCALLAINGQLAFAIVALMISGVCDLFDGFVARRLTRTDAQRKFGGSLDSVVDACSFGFAPVVLMYAAGLNGWLEIPLLILFSICVVWRLAYFDTVGLLESRKHNYFVGLPVTYVAMFLPLAFLSGFWSESALRACVGVTLVGLAVSMVSAIPVRKPSGVFYLLFPTAGVVLTVVFIVFAQSFVR